MTNVTCEAQSKQNNYIFDGKYRVFTILKFLFT